jgi:hypothetical protein
MPNGVCGSAHREIDSAAAVLLPSVLRQFRAGLGQRAATRSATYSPSGVVVQ